MVYPAIKLHQLYSLNLYDGLDIIFEDLSMLNIKTLEDVMKTKQIGNINFVDRILSINTREKTIQIVGNKINESTYIINKQGRGDIILLNYKCSDEKVFTAIEYLYHMYKNLV
jgi:hypothetical protein